MYSNSAVLPGVNTKNKKTKPANKRLSIFNRRLAIKASILILIILVMVGSFSGFAKAYDGKIYPKVMVDGVKIGGMTYDEAKAVLQQKVQALNNQTPTIVYKERIFNPTLDNLGATYDIDKTLAESFNYGRGENLLSRLKENLEMLAKNKQIELVPQINEAKLTNYIEAIAQTIDIPVRDKQIEDGTGKILDEGQDGLAVDREKLATILKEILWSGKINKSIELPTKVIAKKTITYYPHAQPGRFPGRYIDINLSEQTLYAFEDTNLVNQFLISSGKRGYDTPTGEYSVWGKTRSQLMDGPDYYLPNVPWISWFNGEISIHGTYWHHNFGHPMSHGCINASIADAQWIYNWDDIGTPVYVHY